MKTETHRLAHNANDVKVVKQPSYVLVVSIPQLSGQKSSRSESEVLSLAATSYIGAKIE